MTRRPQLRDRDPGDGRAALTSPDRDGAAPKVRLRERTAAPSRRSRVGGRRLLQPLPLLGLVLILIALIGYWSVYSSTTHRTPVLVTTHALPAGATLRASDLRTAELAGDASVMASLVPERRLDDVIGRRLAAALPAGTPLPASALSAQTPSSSALTLAVPVLHALGGALKPGDRVTVLATFGAGTGQARTRAIARGLEVLAVGQPPQSVDSTTATVPITVAVPDASLASQLALANDNGKINLLREGGGGRTAAIPPASEGSGP